VHPVDVAAQRVDFTVVRDEPVGMGERPRRKRVGAESLVYEGQRRFHVGIAEIRERRLDLRRGEHALVDQRARRQARDVEPLSPDGRKRVDRMLHSLADDIQLALEGQRVLREGVAEVGGGADEKLLDRGTVGARGRAEVIVFDRHVPPPEEVLSLLDDHACHELLDSQPGAGLGGEKHGADSVAARGRQGEAQEGRDLAQKAVGHLNQNARAVSRVGFAPARPAVLQVDQHLEAARDDGVRTAARDIYDEPDATSIVFERRVIQTVALRRITVSIRHAQVIAGLLRLAK
jgi:hypothetical protein